MCGRSGLQVLSQPSSAQNDSQAQKDGQAGPGDAVQGGFGAAGAAEHRAAAGCQAAHAVPFGAVEEHKNDQQKTAADPGPGQDGREHQTGRGKRADSGDGSTLVTGSIRLRPVIASG